MLRHEVNGQHCQPLTYFLGLGHKNPPVCIYMMKYHKRLWETLTYWLSVSCPGNYSALLSMLWDLTTALHVNLFSSVIESHIKENNKIMPLLKIAVCFSHNISLSLHIVNLILTKAWPGYWHLSSIISFFSCKLSLFENLGFSHYVQIVLSIVFLKCWCIITRLFCK